MEKSILGIDPALHKTGLCILNDSEKFIIFERVFFKDPLDFTYLDLFKRVQKNILSIQSVKRDFEPDIIAVETPLPTGRMSAGGSAYTTALLVKMMEWGLPVYGFHPSFLGFVLRKKKYDHKELVELAQNIIDKEEYRMNIKRFSADEAVAFLLAYRISIKERKRESGVERFNVEKELLFKGVESTWHAEDNLQRLNGVI